MSDFGHYLLSIVCCGIACSICGSITDCCEKSDKFIKSFMGSILCIVCLTPILRFDPTILERIPNEIHYETIRFIEEGKQLQNKVLEQSISDKITSYIGGVADEFRVNIKAEVVLEQKEIKEIIISGQIPPNTRIKMIKKITNDLGVGDDQIQWKS